MTRKGYNRRKQEAQALVRREKISYREALVRVSSPEFREADPTTSDAVHHAARSLYRVRALDSFGKAGMEAASSRLFGQMAAQSAKFDSLSARLAKPAGLEHFSKLSALSAKLDSLAKVTVASAGLDSFGKSATEAASTRLFGQMAAQSAKFDSLSARLAKPAGLEHFSKLSALSAKLDSLAKVTVQYRTEVQQSHQP